MLMLVLCGGLVAATSLVLSARLAETSTSQWLVGAYVLSFAEIVVVALLLSPFSAFSRWPVLAVVSALFAAALVAVRPVRLPPYRDTARTLVEAVRDPVIAVVSAVAAGATAYSVALGLFRPPNDQDAVGYHLARAAFWAQQHAVGFIAGAKDVRLDSFAPNGEIVMAFTMVTSGSGRYAPLVQLVAAMAGAAAICGIARRLGLGVRESVLAGLVFITLPVVALQMSTGLNDVIVGALVATAAFFLLRGTTANLVLGAISTALLVGTKLTGLLALPGLGLLALVARKHRPLVVLGVGALAIAIGAYWYVYAYFEPGEAPGQISDSRGGQAGVVTVIGRSIRLMLAADELPGAMGLDHLLYVLAAVVVAAFALSFGAAPLRKRYRQAAVASGLVLLPLALVPLGHGILRTTRKIFFELGRSDVGDLDAQRSATKASPIFSWYGPLGVILTLLAIFLTIRAVRRHALPTVAVVLAVAPLIWIVLLAIAVPYWEWNGRYTIGGFALSTAAWAYALRIRPVAWATAAIAVLTVGLSFVHQHDRPSGLRLLEPTPERSVWSEPDWSVVATDHAELRAVLPFVDEHVPPHARIAIEPTVFPVRGLARGDMPAYAFFGTDLQRHVELADSLARARVVDADWAVLRANHVRGCPRGWRVAFRFQNWVVLKRTSSPRCRS
jgi:hypothetical protein